MQLEPTRSDATRPLHVLIVEDCPDTAASLTFLMTAWGYAATVAPSGPAALSLAAAEPPDVVLLDINLPRMNGWDVARRLRHRAAMDGTLLVALSGYGSDHDRQHSFDAGCHIHLTKPVDPRVLEHLLRRKSYDLCPEGDGVGL